MGNRYRNRRSSLRSIILIIKAVYYRSISRLSSIGSEIDLYGRLSSFKLLIRGEFKLFLELFCSPLNIVRYFELPFVVSSIDWSNASNCLDISSPRIYFLYILSKYKNVSIDIVNPDCRDLAVTSRYLDAIINDLGRVKKHSFDASTLPFSDESFDIVSSISVIEHIPGDGDTFAIGEMWRVLKPGGNLVLTFPCAREYADEFRDQDVYEQGAPQNGQKYFFQRIYNADAINTRLLKPIDAVPKKIAFFGEKRAGTYSAYESRWIKRGLAETVKDPYYISTQYKEFDRIEDLPGLGVCCMLLEKGFSR